MRRILIAGGGTGGHVFPGLAIAKALVRLADVEVVFAGSPRGLEARLVPEHGYALELLDVEPMIGGGAQRAIRGALVAAKVMRKAHALVRKLAPAAVLSVGGYAAGPAALACVSRRVPLAILEPNSILGLTNRILAPFARRGYVAWSSTRRHFGKGRSRLMGVPLRASFEPRPYTPQSPLRVLVLGGSQGAVALNTILPHAFGRLGAFELEIVHQTGRGREEAVRAAYGSTPVEIFPFLDDIATRMAAADLIVARAGAVTVAEISAIGRAAVLVPFPHAADDHQTRNAESLASVGAAVCLRQKDADEAHLARVLQELLTDEPRRVRMADAARTHGRPNAAEDIARDLLDLAGIGLRKIPPTNGSSSHVQVLDHDKGVS